MKRQLLQLLTREPIMPLFRPFQLGAVTIVMLHRFADPNYGNEGHSVSTLRANLAFLRRHRFRLIGLTDLLDQFDASRWPSTPGVAFTVDDGYGDFARVAAPVFAEFDCPVTVFLTTAFIDGGFWMWWDKIAWAFDQTKKSSLEIRTRTTRQEYELDCPVARRRAILHLTERLKRVPHETAQSTIEELLCRAEVELPANPPGQFAPMTWRDVSLLTCSGVTFGPHTVTHPILSQIAEGRVTAELQESWARLRRATSSAIPVFCYPNGDYASFGDRERRLLRALGMRASVIAEHGFTKPRRTRLTDESEIIELTRFPYADDDAEFRQIVGGMERLKDGIRRLSRPFLASSADHSGA